MRIYKYDGIEFYQFAPYLYVCKSSIKNNLKVYTLVGPKKLKVAADINAKYLFEYLHGNLHYVDSKSKTKH